jgi:transcription elongation factor Elf1
MALSLAKVEDIEGSYTNEITCPWCGHETSNSWEVESGSEDLGLQLCNECEKGFYATRNISVDYSTRKAEYGTCSECNAEDVLIESGRYHMMYPFTNLCNKCKSEHYKSSNEKYMEYINQNFVVQGAST